MVQIAEYHITPDDDYNTFSYNAGLKIIKNFDIEVHYEETEMQNKYIKVLKEKRNKIYAITNKGGVIVDNEEITLLGDIQTFIYNRE